METKLYITNYIYISTKNDLRYPKITCPVKSSLITGVFRAAIFVPILLTKVVENGPIIIKIIAHIHIVVQTLEVKPMLLLTLCHIY